MGQKLFDTRGGINDGIDRCEACGEELPFYDLGALCADCTFREREYDGERGGAY